MIYNRYDRYISAYPPDGVAEEVELSSKELVPGDQILLPATGGKYHHRHDFFPPAQFVVG